MQQTQIRTLAAHHPVRAASPQLLATQTIVRGGRDDCLLVRQSGEITG